MQAGRDGSGALSGEGDVDRSAFAARTKGPTIPGHLGA